MQSQQSLIHFNPTLGIGQTARYKSTLAVHFLLNSIYFCLKIKVVGSEKLLSVLDILTGARFPLLSSLEMSACGKIHSCIGI